MSLEQIDERLVVRQAGDGPATWAMGGLFEHLVTAADSAGAAFASREDPL